MYFLRTFKYSARYLVLVFLILNVAECRRTGGSRISFSSRPASRPSYSHPSPSPSYSRPSYPSPSYQRPSPSYSRPSSHPSPGSLSYSHIPSHSSSPSHPSRPLGFDNVRPGTSSSGTHTAPIGPPVSTKPLNSAPPNYGFSPSATHGVGTSSGGSHGSNTQPIGFKPSVTQGTGIQSHSPNNQPHAPGFKASAPPAEHATNTKPLGNSHSGPSGVTPPTYGFKPSAPVGPPTNVKPVGNAYPGAAYPVQPPPYTPHNPGIPPPAYNPAHNPAGYGPPPAYNPAHNPAGYGPPPPAYNGHAPAYGSGYGHYPQQQYHPGGYGYPNQPHMTSSGGVTNININNINTNHHPPYGGGYYGGGYSGIGSGFGYHYNSYPSYHYSSGDVGSGTLGFFLGYSLAKITTPTYHTHSSFYSGYTPRYDHYEVHHYYHNKDSVPAQSTIQPNTIIGCVGDSGTICPVGTTSLCTNNGAILCVASATNTVPCTDKIQGNCVRTTIPCVNGTGDCEIGQNKTVTIPCVSTAKVPGNITYVNNTIIVNNTTIINNFNATSNGTVSSTNTTLATTSTVVNGTVPMATNLTNSLALVNNMTTTTEIPTTLPPQTTQAAERSKRETPPVPDNEFCVTILALPAERKPTEQEKLLQKGTGIFSKFLVKALGAS